ncbi:MAG: phosphatase PAP2 family protein [Bacillota bacterium]|nr:phosphatase PAP2 family protein [Bacillota bacterium]
MNKRNIWLVIVPVILFIMLAICVKAGITANFESWTYSEAVKKMSPALTSIVKGITHMGDSVVIIALCLLFIIIPKSRKTIALPVSITVILSSILNVILKNIFARERPDILRLINETSYSFPSGHAMNNGAFYTMLILLIFKYIKDKRVRYTLSALCGILVISIGYSRIYLGVHYADDVLGGWLIGFSVAILVYYIFGNRLSSRKDPKEKSIKSFNDI